EPVAHEPRARMARLRREELARLGDDEVVEALLEQAGDVVVLLVALGLVVALRAGVAAPAGVVAILVAAGGSLLRLRLRLSRRDGRRARIREARPRHGPGGAQPPDGGAPELHGSSLSPGRSGTLPGWSTRARDPTLAGDAASESYRSCPARVGASERVRREGGGERVRLRDGAREPVARLSGPRRCARA